MRKDIYEYFITDNVSGKKCNENWISKNNTELYQSIIDWCKDSILENIEFKRKVYHYIYNLKEIPKCKVCNSSVQYKRLIDGYSVYCSNKCVKNSEEYKNKWRNSWHENNEDGKTIQKRNETLEKKYGMNYINIIKDNRKKSMMKKYGVENPFQIEEVQIKRKYTLKEKYGSETYNNPDKTKETRISNKTQIDDSLITDFYSYKTIAINRTSTIYTK